MTKITILSILCVCVCVTVNAQTHDQNNTNSTFFSDNFFPTKHFDGVTLGSTGGNLFIGGENGEKGLMWNAMEGTFPDASSPTGFSSSFGYTGSRSAAKIDYSHWNQLWVLKFSDNSASTGNKVTWKNGLLVQRKSTGDIEMRMCGNFYAKEININAGINWCDYVFADDYKLMSLGKLEQYIKTYKHLPEVPSELEVKENGIAVTEMLQIQMKKIEELTLYTIQQQKEIEELRALLAAKN